MSFVWYWTFWHWSRESFQAGVLLRSPLQGIGGHWDEWFRHEAAPNELRTIDEMGRDVASQRQFVAWLYRHWWRESEWREDRSVPRFVLGQLANFAPFNRWPAFDKYRKTDGSGVSAIVLAEGSQGESTDVRDIETLALPAGSRPAADNVFTENFHAERENLETARQAAVNLLRGKGLLLFLALWAAGGRRPHPAWLKISLATGWTATGGLILYLLFGPDPGRELPLILEVLTGLWVTLTASAILMAAWQSFQAWRLGKRWCAQLERSQIRFRMDGNLTVKGGSAGLALCLNTLLSVYRSRPGLARQSWLWARIFRQLQADRQLWAATGVITRSGLLKPVVLDQKIRACLRHEGIRHLLTPRQSKARGPAIDHAADEAPTPVAPPAIPPAGTVRLGFADERSPLECHPCRHAAQALLTAGHLFSKPQMLLNLVAFVISAAMIAAIPDVRSIVFPYASPEAVPPSSPSSGYLWVSLDTRHPAYFQVQLESGYWANRRAEVKSYSGANASVRAEVPLRKFSGKTTGNAKVATIWVERRQRFLTREFAPGERVGRYTLPYLVTLGYH